MNQRDLLELKEKVGTLTQQRDQAQGALDHLMTQLKDKFGCPNLEEAEKLALVIRKEEQKAEKVFEDSLTKFEEKWGDELK